jgi:predicted nucleotide-binding protein
MDYEYKLARLEHLKGLLDRYTPVMYSGSEEQKQLHQEICETYGEVADIFDEVVGKQKIQVSGRTFHTHQGETELLKVIGRVKTLLSAPKESSTAVAAVGHRVFLVHGHNEAVLQSCARFVEKLELPVTILREEPNQGRTIIEKFLDYADAGFAIVLLTADDRGGPIDQAYDVQMPRARQCNF